MIAGGTGFVGKYLTEQFRNSGYEVILISRQAQGLRWSDTKGIIRALENSDMLINLAGKSVNCRYNQKNREEILKSRTVTTRQLGEAMLKCKNPPELWINASAATIYRNAEDRPMTESTGETGKGFSAEVAAAWEEVFFSFRLRAVRQVALRITIVLGKEGGVVKPFVKLVRFGLGGKQGSGKQMFSWIHMEDLFGIILFLQSRKELNGAFNCCSPHPVDNATLMRTLRQTMHMKFGLPSPAWLLKIGARIIRTEPELVLNSRWVIPERLLEAGYIFRYPVIDGALKNILRG